MLAEYVRARSSLSVLLVRETLNVAGPLLIVARLFKRRKMSLQGSGRDLPMLEE